LAAIPATVAVNETFRSEVTESLSHCHEFRTFRTNVMGKCGRKAALVYTTFSW